MKITYYISPPDDDGLSSVLVGRWDVSVPIEKAAEAWPCCGIVNAEGKLRAFNQSEADRQVLVLYQPLMPGTTITMEDE